jgi:hypothetical protein
MPTTPDQFAVSDAEFTVTVNNNLKYCTANQADLGISKKDLDTYTLKNTVWNSSWEKAKDPSHATVVDVAAKNDAKTDLLKFLRPFVKKVFYNNPDISDSMILDAGLRPHSKTKTSYGKPKETPTFEVVPLAANTLQIITRNEQGKKSKPAGVLLIRTRYFIGENPPSDPADFPKFVDATKNPIKIFFNKADAGKDLTIAICYVGNNGVEGAYGIVVTIKVP